ncbi:DUF4170 domain-containing protein [Neoroseomonas oryzicola]|uniref:DUF4170 domain-containing protein n=1 Tax=Neoroseomonas oryzicola TaxID=535904 RepID=A0A9X9WQI1_9PROT|nr:DUF4170 domain-containing protein [Neoroseomonas oryzicola]MBR0662591.1 DUF4170 domain-containing protein [Neoroseomonas oryzicola]NKE19482.1 DUF4170 domain-containing protein [Neoroseomonas oryzicola]
MTARTLYFVWGGIFTDSTWQELEAGTEQCFGPYHDAATAERVWRDETRRMVDTAQHRLFVLEVPRPAGEAAA